MTPIAVIGIDCRFPGAPDKDAFWQLLMNGVVTDTEIPSLRWDVDAYYHPDGRPGSMNTRRAHFIDDVDAFDNEFFGIAPTEAAGLDPQQRLLLQTSWRALEDAGIDPRSLAGAPTGVFVGLMSSEWGSVHILDFGGLTPFRVAGSGYFMTANRISYHLNLNGPSIAIDSACSSSLIAVHQGCAALRSGECDTVIAAGANLLVIPALSIYYTQAGLSAPDGRCKPFGQSADGIGRGEGVAAVVLRRLDDALADGQPIYAVVKSSVANHDGRSNGITAPNRRSQVQLMQRALSLAQIDADQISFVEAHGTGTVLGDMIESNALGDIHKTRTGEPCLLGSVKGNIGHTEGSAGIASLIKATLALHHRMLPPTVFGGSANPRLRLGEHGLLLADTPRQLPDDGALGAVSSFGLGGSNAHAVLESAPPGARPHPGFSGILTLSAPSEQALRRNAVAYEAALNSLDNGRLTSWCRTTNLVKRSHRHRLVIQGDRTTLIGELRRYIAGANLASSSPARTTSPTVGLLSPGQGTQYPGMTRPLYEDNPLYRRHLDDAASALRPHLPSDPLAVIFGDDDTCNQTRFAQPALFAVSYALGKTLLQSGVRPAFGVGHSVGEIAIACLAGVLSVRDAARLVALRGELMGSLPANGTMIAVDLPLEQAEALVSDEPQCAIAAVNGPRSLTISGAAQAITEVEAAVRAQGGRVVRLSVSHAFHSPLMAPIVERFQRELSGLEPAPATFSIFSTVLGREIAGEEMGADYWSQQICSPVRFLDAAQVAIKTANTDYVAEVGSRPTLSKLFRQCGLPLKTSSLTLCEGPGSRGDELLTATAKMIRDGYSIDLSAAYGERSFPLQRIPAYTFDMSNRYWLDGSQSAVTQRAEPFPGTAPVRPELPVQPPVGGQEGKEAEVLDLIAGIGGYSVAKISRSSRLDEDLGYDSLMQVRLFDRLRTRYPELKQMSLAEVLPKIHSVGDIIDIVVQLLSDGRASE
ncbi:MAG: type I polyketide synthase [Mycolicibacterium sp.]|uniref:type I polyketide synthase n=1 Tax=Mycolicibacterium sp. TaxID=2320850 RepID=UPI003D10DE5C